ncbi:hypothetical protein RJT34_00267 [Clitoria ternatea]|uniref:Uncharacterized protein n=1 Tax=Clitoria ternatea TaxID=43366 RepID=A0AAN9KFT3_CLITE
MDLLLLIANVLHPFATQSNSNFAALSLDVGGVSLALTSCRHLLLQKIMLSSSARTKEDKQSIFTVPKFVRSKCLVWLVGVDRW